MNSSTAHPSRKVRHVVFDFDGTLSWLRHGWPAMMLDVFAAHLPEKDPASQHAVRAELLRLVMSLNGKPTILQIHAFCRYAATRNLSVPEAEQLRQSYQETLDQHILERSGQVRDEKVPVDAYVVAGAREFLKSMRATGIRLSILSSTVEHRVREEAELLGIASFFEGRIHGSPPDPAGFSKRAVFERILRSEGIEGSALVSFGDGPEEIASTRDLGGLAVAVCTDEHVNGSGECDALKREQLLEAGAHFAIPDFTAAHAILKPFLD